MSADNVDTVTALESAIIGNNSEDDNDDGRITVNGKHKTHNQLALCCKACKKEFDSSAPGAHPIYLLCTECNPEKGEISFPDISSRKSAKSDDVSDDGEHDTDSSNDIVAVNGEEEAPDDVLPEFEDVEQDEISDDYTGFNTAKELSNHFAAAKLSKQPCAIKIGSMGLITCVQSKDPDDYDSAGLEAFFRFKDDPVEVLVKRRIIFYGYDIYEAWQSKERVLVTLCMIMREDGFPSRYILFKLGKTRCVHPVTRVLDLLRNPCNLFISLSLLHTNTRKTRCVKSRLDGFLYNIKDQR